MAILEYCQREVGTVTRGGSGDASFTRNLLARRAAAEKNPLEVPLVLKFSSGCAGGYAEAVVRSVHGRRLADAAKNANISEGTYRISEVGGGRSEVLFSRTGYQEMCRDTGAIVIHSGKPLQGATFVPVNELLWLVNSKKISIKMDAENPKYGEVKKLLTQNGILFTEKDNALFVSGINRVSAVLELGGSFRNSSTLLQLNGSVAKAA